MTERKPGLITIGLVLLLIGLGLYGLTAMLAGGAALALAALQIWPIFLVLAPITIGAALILIGVVRDRLKSDEDSYYSRNIDQ